jgi:hypothetical protein
MAKFRDIKTLQKFAAVHASIHNHFNHDRHLNRRDIFKQNRTAALALPIGSTQGRETKKGAGANRPPSFASPGLKLPRALVSLCFSRSVRFH